MFKIVLTVLLMVVCISPALGQNVDFEWLQTDLYPFIISEGPQRGTGAGDYAMDIINQLLGAASVPRFTLPGARILADLKNGRKGLWPTAIRTPEREASLTFSAPYVVINPVVWVTRSTASYPEILQLTELASRPNLRLIRIRGRSYGPILDEFMTSLDPMKVTIFNNLKDEFLRINQLMDLGRIEGFFAYEVEVTALLRDAGLPETSFSYHGIEGLPPTLVGIAGPATPWGREIIDSINTIMKELRPLVAQRYSLYLAPGSRTAYLALSRELLGY